VGCGHPEKSAPELDPIVKKELSRMKQVDLNINITEILHEIISYHNRIFPVFDLTRIEKIEIGIRPQKRQYVMFLLFPLQ
jgi:hypothetical protein